jgi:hypothetical protein
MTNFFLVLPVANHEAISWRCSCEGNVGCREVWQWSGAVESRAPSISPISRLSSISRHPKHYSSNLRDGPKLWSISVMPPNQPSIANQRMDSCQEVNQSSAMDCWPNGFWWNRSGNWVDCRICFSRRVQQDTESLCLGKGWCHVIDQGLSLERKGAAHNWRWDRWSTGGNVAYQWAQCTCL